MVQIVFTINGGDVAGAYVNEIIRRLENALPLMQDIAFYGEETTQERIADTNVGPDGQAWKQSARAKADGGRTLFAEGNLHNDISSEATADSAIWGANLIYARIHQEGGVIEATNGKALHFAMPGGGFVTVKSVTIPARPYLGLSAENLEVIDGKIESYFLDGLVGTA
ncbi:phage virion morphogenesis protein [Asticcacaulis biprosthecium C19]|uniref:Phage virion morphogenesis protein n=1 Tax=Asticcacaulis biprosthecium C19 TaxID=715226 RepID=F4QG97_9CAUL|nr:phage virion morphogenesis protein [Asticcacaulis biprosthecium]EGF92425.1 phage virion morphogenesis protein [Asticcacaulis biprosthecium C19]